MFGDRVAHPFDGHGYVRRVAFEPDGSVSLRARFVQTPSYLAEAPRGRLVHRGLATNAHTLWRNIGLGGPPRNVANTTIYPWAGKLLAAWEAGHPTALHLETLETLGPHTFGGLVDGQATLAHMGRDAARGRLVLCNPEIGRRTRFTSGRSTTLSSSCRSAAARWRGSRSRTTSRSATAGTCSVRTRSRCGGSRS